MTKTIKLNEDQQGLVEALMDFMRDDEAKFFLLSGQAGTGKTTSIKFFLNELNRRFDTYTQVALTAPTNKARKVLEESIPNEHGYVYKTIYSLLGLRMMANGAVKELADSGQVEDAGMYDLIVIDEGSMLSTPVLQFLDSKTRFTNTKILIIGDREQLPPVGETESPIWRMLDVNYELTKVERHQNAILAFVQSIRGQENPVLESPGEPVYIVDGSDFMEKIQEYASKGMFHNGQAKAIAWRNRTVDELNHLIRNSYELTKSRKPFVVGDRLVMTEPIASDFTGAPPLANTDDEAVVVNVSVESHPKYPMYKIWSLGLVDDFGYEFTARIIHEDSLDNLNEELNELSEKKNWHKFWQLKEAFHQVKHGYAITSHRSQGSTFKHVFVDAGDILINRDADTRRKCFYVGASRASVNLFIYP